MTLFPKVMPFILGEFPEEAINLGQTTVCVSPLNVLPKTESFVQIGGIPPRTENKG